MHLLELKKVSLLSFVKDFSFTIHKKLLDHIHLWHLTHTKGENNVVADALSRLHIDNTSTSRVETEKPSVSYLAEYYGLDDVDLPDDAYPLKFSLIDKEQKRDIHLLNKIKKNPAYTTKIFHGGGNSYNLIVKHGKIVIPRTLQSRTIKWYHEQLCHPGISRT